MNYRFWSLGYLADGGDLKLAESHMDRNQPVLFDSKEDAEDEARERGESYFPVELTFQSKADVSVRNG